MPVGTKGLHWAGFKQGERGRLPHSLEMERVGDEIDKKGGSFVSHLIVARKADLKRFWADWKKKGKISI